MLGLHLAAVAAGHGLALGAGMNRRDRIAIGFAGSQKTLMVGLHIALVYYGGLAVLPMVAYHTGQLILDTIIGDWLVRREGKTPDTSVDKAAPLDAE